MRSTRLTFSASFFEDASEKRRTVSDKFEFDDYAVIEKVSHLVHAVGRVSDGKGSALLISLPDPNTFNEYQNRLEAAQRRRSSGRTRRSLNRRDHFAESVLANDPMGGSTRTGGFAGRGPRGTHTDGHLDEDPKSAPAEPLMSSNFALLLTTSQVFADADDAAGRTVTFLEQTVAGTAAQLGRQPRPITVAVRSDCGFFTSVPEDSRRGGGASCRHGSGHATRSNATSPTSIGGGAPFSPRPPHSPLSCSHPEAYEVVNGEEPDTVPIGYCMTYCDVLPSEAPHVDRNAESGTDAGSYGCGISFLGSSYASPEPSGRPLGWTNFHAPEAPRQALAPPRGVYPSGTVADMQLSCASLGRYRKPSTEDLFLVKPLHLPLLAASMAPVRSGDVHLWVTHLRDGVRHYTLRRVLAVSEDACEYEDSNDDAVERSSGGIVFDANGDFVGLQHQEGGEALCIFTQSIVKHLFMTNKLALCRSPISTGPPPGYANVLDGNGTDDRDGTAEGSSTCDSSSGQPHTAGNERSTMPSISSGSIRGGPMRVADFQQLLDARLRRERQMPVTQRVPTTEEVFAAFYTDFQSLSRMLHAFSYSSSLTESILAELCKHEHRHHWSSLAASGVVGLTLEIIDGNADNEKLVTTALSTLAQLSIFDGNLTVLVHVDGVPTVLEIMKEYIHSPDVLQWGAYCLYQATSATAPFVADTIDAFTRSAGVELAVECLRQHGLQHRHLTLWTSTLIANVLQREPQFITVVVHEDLPPLLMKHVSHYSDDFAVLEGLLRLLHTIIAPLAGAECTTASKARRKMGFPVAPTPSNTSRTSRSDALAATPPPPATDRQLPEDSSTAITSVPSPHSDDHRRSSSDASGGRSSVTIIAAERNAFFVRRALARQDRLVWNVLAHVCDAASRVNYSTRSVELLQLSVETLSVMVQWGSLPVRRVRNLLASALERTETNYPTASALLESFRQCQAAILDAITSTACEPQKQSPRGEAGRNGGAASGD